MVGSWFPAFSPEAQRRFAAFRRGGGGRGHGHGHRHGPPGGDDPGGGNPFGGNPFGGNPFAQFFRGRRARRGDVRTAILALLAEKPRNGYQIMQELEQRSRGLWRPSPGSVYPALQLLEDEGLVKADEGGGRTFQLTDKGRVYVKEHAAEVEVPWEAARSEADGELADLADLARQVTVAAVQVAHAGTGADLATARKVLKDARRALYQILAEGGSEER